MPIQPSATLRASVTADSATDEGGPATVLVDGADTAVTANGLQDYTPTPGDRLLVTKVGGALEILQFISRGTVPSGGGGVQVFYQDTPPSSANEGDLWYDTTDNGNLAHRWDSGAWVALAVGTAAIADGAVTTAAVAANAITGAQIAAEAVASAQIATGAVGANQSAVAPASPFNAIPDPDFRVPAWVDVRLAPYSDLVANPWAWSQSAANLLSADTSDWVVASGVTFQILQPGYSGEHGLPGALGITIFGTTTAETEVAHYDFALPADPWTAPNIRISSQQVHVRLEYLDSGGTVITAGSPTLDLLYDADRGLTFPGQASIGVPSGAVSGRFTIFAHNTSTSDTEVYADVAAWRAPGAYDETGIALGAGSFTITATGELDNSLVLAEAIPVPEDAASARITLNAGVLNSADGDADNICPLNIIAFQSDGTQIGTSYISAPDLTAGTPYAWNLDDVFTTIPQGVAYLKVVLYPEVGGGSVEVEVFYIGLTFNPDELQVGALTADSALIGYGAVYELGVSTDATISGDVNVIGDVNAGGVEHPPSMYGQFQQTSGLALSSGGYTNVTSQNHVGDQWGDDGTGYTASSGVWTIHVAGIYLVTASYTLNGPAHTGRFIFRLLQNGVGGVFQVENPLGTSGNMSVGGSIVLEIKAGDTLTFQLYQSTGSSQNLVTAAGANGFTITRLMGTAPGPS